MNAALSMVTALLNASSLKFRLNRLVLIWFLTAVCFVTANAAPTKWVGTWGCAPYLVESANMPPSPGLANNTLRQVVKVSIGGNQVRLKLSNKQGNAPLVISAVHLANSTGGSSINASSDVALRFGGSASVTIPAGSTATSDSLSYTLTPLSKVAVSIVFGTVPSSLTGHPGSRTTSYLQGGNSVSASSLASAKTTVHWYILTGIDVYTESTSKAVIALGDSITDGNGTTTDANNRWTDTFATRLYNNTATKNLVGVLNEAIGGTLASGSGLTRFDVDVLGQSGKRYLVVLYGINDILYAGKTSSSVISAYKTYISKCHNNGMLAYGGTILPCGGSSAYTAAREQTRQDVNKWIKSTSAANGGFDGVIDFDAALRDPNTSTRLLSTYDSGDHLHPNPSGYSKMANTISLSLFTQ